MPSAQLPEERWAESRQLGPHKHARTQGRGVLGLVGGRAPLCGRAQAALRGQPGGRAGQDAEAHERRRAHCAVVQAAHAAPKAGALSHKQSDNAVCTQLPGLGHHKCKASAEGHALLLERCTAWTANQALSLVRLQHLWRMPESMPHKCRCGGSATGESGSAGWQRSAISDPASPSALAICTSMRRVRVGQQMCMTCNHPMCARCALLMYQTLCSYYDNITQSAAAQRHKHLTRRS